MTSNTSTRAMAWLGILLGLTGGSSRAAEAGAPDSRPGITLVVTGEPGAAHKVRDALPRATDFPVVIVEATLPNTAPAQAPEALGLEAPLQRARRHYVDAEFPACLEVLGHEGLLTGALTEGLRQAAARLLFWRAACHVGRGELEAAREVAAELGVLGLEVPADVEAASPEVGRVVAEAAGVGLARPRAALQVVADEAPGQVSVDGRPGLCATPCALELPEGRHVVRLDVEGRLPAIQVVSLRTPGTEVAIRTTPAPPEVAAAQWTSRYAARGEVDSAGALRLLSTALRAPRLVLLAAEPESSRVRLRGALALDGQVAVRTERGAEATRLPGAVEGLLRDLLTEAKVVEPPPPLYRRPGFWIAVGAVALAAGATTAVLMHDPGVRTEVTF